MNLSAISRFLFIPILFSLITVRLAGQTPVRNYEKEWKRVSDFSDKGLPKSALAEVKKIYALAKAQKQPAQLIKSLVYITNLQAETREDNELLSVNEIEKEIGTATEPVKSLLKNILAEIYWQYFQNNRWIIYDRTKTENFNKSDISTWAADDFHKRISNLFLESLQAEKTLVSTRLSDYDALITKGNVRHLRPTLFDLLAHRALLYFSNDERNISKPAYAFEISEPGAFDPAAAFVKLKFPTRDSLSLEHKALLIYQRLLSLHLPDPRPDALIDADLLRLQFIKEKSTHPEKDKLYFEALNSLAGKYGNLPAASQAWYLMADWHRDNAAGYKPYGDSTHRFDLLKARAICEQVIRQKDSSEGKINCQNLLREISKSSFRFSLEKVNQPSQAFRSLVSYRNISKLYLRILSPDAFLKQELANRNDEKYWSLLTSLKAQKQWEQTLPNPGDFQEHSAEIKIEGLPTGEYILLASDQPDFSGKKTILGARLFYVSGISFVNMQNDYFVLDRENGRPLAAANVQVWEQRYDYTSSKNIREKGKSYTTDANGYFKMEKGARKPNDYSTYYFNLDISWKNDRLFMNEYMYDYYYYNQAETEPASKTGIYLFTDRSLYRPGQTVYFKGIVLNYHTGQKTGMVNSHYNTKVVLRDANYKDIDTIPVLTNEYGSFSGKFTLPQTGLNGQFSIYTKTDNGNVSFRVEEYKRPKFYVEFEPVKGSYKVNDLIKVTGLAKAYAGNMIDGAMVKYRVVREPRFLYPWMFSRWWQPPAEEMEIAHGELKTDKDGRFKLEFKALPDGKIDRQFDPVFDYRIYADITDLNGETRSGEQNVSAGYKSLLLSGNIPASMPADSLKKLSIRTTNMNGEYEPALVRVVFSKLRAENRLIRERFWPRPDQFVMSKETYIRNFPHDEYDNENNFQSWEKERKVFEGSDSSRNDGTWNLVHTGTGTAASFTPGFYVVEISTRDKEGNEIKDQQYLELTDEKSRELNRPLYTWKGMGKTTAMPGETASVEMGTSADSLFIVQQVSRDNNMPAAGRDYSYNSLSVEKRTFQFPVQEKDRGGFGAGWMFVKHNRVYQLNQLISVPWDNKELKIEYASFRDKTLPGSEEKWKVKITGNKGEKLAAEMLASMYDQSLDQFYFHAWSKPAIWPVFYNLRSWDGSQNFNQQESQQRYISGETQQYVNKQYDFLIGGYDGGSRDKYKKGYMSFDGAPAPVTAPPGVREEADGDGVSYRNVDKVLVGKVSGLHVSGSKDGYGEILNKSLQTGEPSGEVKIRKNFNETAFFLPDLHTDSSGAIEFSFTMPESLTKWKFMSLFHTKDAAFGYSTREIITQKDLMVQPNAPRFLREGDKMEFSAKIVNMTDKEITGMAEFQLLDAETNEPVDGRFKNAIPNQYFTVAPGQSEAVNFPMEVPYQFDRALLWRVVAKAGTMSDGEENALPVLSNRMLVTETMPLTMRGNGSRNFSFTKLLNAGNSESLQHHNLTVEYTSNPAWYAVQALPYLMEYPYECAEQTWNRYYANSIASHIAGSNQKIRQVFDKWKIRDSSALVSKLQKNQELKSVLLEETPWVLQAKNESEQKRNIALLFDMLRMSEQLNSTYDKLKQMQSSNGGFVWFSGGPDDRYITQYIVTGIGHLQKLQALAGNQAAKLKAILQTAIPYLDRKIKEDYDDLIRYKTNLKTYTPGYTVIQYLYMRSFFPDYPVATASRTAYDYFKGRAGQTWVPQSKYMQGMIALALHRSGDTRIPADILKSLKETSISHEELGMYWKDQAAGWFWYEAPIETQALLIEAFSEAGKDNQSVDELRTWLLKNKQTNNWKTTKATAEACYALLLQGSNWLDLEPEVSVKLGNMTVSNIAAGEAGTGYFKKTIEGSRVLSNMGNITVTVSTPVNKSTNQPVNLPTWGAVYWQYFEDLDKITTASTPLKLSKKLFVEKNSDRGPVLIPVNDGDVLNVGDKIKVRVELRVDRDMEYVHMKDMRAAALEPVNVLSEYKWQGGLGYYESTKDASTNFFFSYLRKGTYVFEYPLFVTHTGNFSNGITSIQCMYAPEFSSHSEGIRINVE